MDEPSHLLLPAVQQTSDSRRCPRWPGSAGTATLMLLLLMQQAGNSRHL